MAVNIRDALAVIFYFFAVTFVGVWYGRKLHAQRPQHPLLGKPEVRHPSRESKAMPAEGADYVLRLFIANSNVPLWLSCISMTATWVGAGYLNGAAEAVFTSGMLWCQAPIGYAISLILGGRFFAAKMRITEAITMLDPFQHHYGRWIAVMLCLPALCGEIFWTASILSALGHTMQTIISLNSTTSIVVSSAVILLYTMLGGHYSVVYTDILQLSSALVGLWICVPYILTNDNVGKIGSPETDWIGKIEPQDLSQHIDVFLMTVLGGIPWQAYFQQVLGADSIFTARMLSYTAAFGVIILAIPPIVIGSASKSTNFTATKYGGPFNLSEGDRTQVLPLAIQFLTPSLISMIGLIAIMGAVMSSMDSSMLSASSLITWNIFRFIVRPTASDVEVSVALRVMVVLLGMLATVLALNVKSVFALWTLSSDLVYVLLFPQFVALFYFRQHSNAYGSFAGFTVGCVLRCLCGEPLLNVPVTVQLPFYDEKRGQQFPFRTACMIATFHVMQAFSFLTKWAFQYGIIPEELDVWNCFAEDAPMVDLAKARSSSAAIFSGTPTAPPTPISFEVRPSTPPDGDQQQPEQMPASTTMLPPTSAASPSTDNPAPTMAYDPSSKLVWDSAGSISTATRARSIRRKSTRKSLSVLDTDNPMPTTPYGRSATDSVGSSSAARRAGSIRTRSASRKSSTKKSSSIPNTENPTPTTPCSRSSKSAADTANTSPAMTPAGIMTPAVVEKTHEEAHMKKKKILRRQD